MTSEAVHSTEDGRTQKFRADVQQFLRTSLPQQWGQPGFRPWTTEQGRIEFLRDWQRRLYEARFAAIAWPEEFGGRGANLSEQLVFSEELARVGAPEPINHTAGGHVGPTIIQYGTDWQKAHFLPRMLSGQDLWCQGFSEPDAGSDLASLKTTGELIDNEYRITGQKIWTTNAQHADWSYVLARTDLHAPKHKGITYFLVPMKTGGVTVRPLRQISGTSEFNAVYFDGVKVSPDLIVGEVNQGWKVATTTLGFERALQGTSTRLDRRLRIVTQLAVETIVDGKSQFDDDAVREKLVGFAAIAAAVRHIGWTEMLARLKGIEPGSQSGVAKLLRTEADQRMSEFGLDLLGQLGVLTAGSEHAVKGGNAALSYLIMRGATIGGGTSEVQRNIIGERLLGLPR